VAASHDGGGNLSVVTSGVGEGEENTGGRGGGRKGKRKE
jgi:hypothetical protein